MVTMKHERPAQLRGALFALSAAVLFGLSSPLAKRLLSEMSPLMLAALLYLGGGAGLALWRLVTRGKAAKGREARLRRGDWPLLILIVVLGGAVGPVLMLVGLSRLAAVSAALLLNLEAPFTIAVAVAFFGEHLGRRAAVAAALIVAGAAVLAWRPGELHADLFGVAALAGACLSWALDNNLTQRLSLRDPVALVRVKGLGAGTCTLLVALLAGHDLPPAGMLPVALLVGSLSYGLSIVLDAYALRALGAAREAAYFATAPFIGAVAAVPLLGEPFRRADLAGMALMGFGVVQMLRERHFHLHTHLPLAHDHAHVHDEHHQHEHPPGTPPGEPHAHPHRHEAMTHEHPHVPDLHHRHRH